MRILAALLSLACLVILSGCIDIGEIWIINDTVSVGPKGEVALCIDEEIYVTDLNGSRFTRVTENDVYDGAVSWSRSGLLYVENQEDRWTLNIGREVLLQEMNKILSPVYSSELSYFVLGEEETYYGNINIYEKDTSRIYTLLEDVYYDYEWLPGSRRIAAITSQGVLLIKDIDNLLEEVVYNGDFKAGDDYMDITRDNNIIFSSNGEIYLYNIDSKELSKWQGKEGYDYRLPPSINSNLKGYIVARVKSIEDDWTGQVYLVDSKGGFISVPAWPIWIDEPMVVCMDQSNGDVLVTNLEKNETINLTEKYYEQAED